jgi:hypothetical protein
MANCYSQGMTLLVALKGKDGLVLAADSRGTFGDPRGITAQNDNQQKAHILSPHVAVLAAGSGEVGALIRVCILTFNLLILHGISIVMQQNQQGGIDEAFERTRAYA